MSPNLARAGGEGGALNPSERIPGDEVGSYLEKYVTGLGARIDTVSDIWHESTASQKGRTDVMIKNRQ